MLAVSLLRMSFRAFSRWADAPLEIAFRGTSMDADDGLLAVHAVVGHFFSFPI